MSRRHNEPGEQQSRYLLNAPGIIQFEHKGSLAPHVYI